MIWWNLRRVSADDSLGFSHASREFEPERAMRRDELTPDISRDFTQSPQFYLVFAVESGPTSEAAFSESERRSEYQAPKAPILAV